MIFLQLILVHCVRSLPCTWTSIVGWPQTHFSRGIAYCRLIFTGTEALAVCGRIVGVAAAAAITGVAVDRTACILLERPQHMLRPVFVYCCPHNLLLLYRLLGGSNRINHLL